MKNLTTLLRGRIRRGVTTLCTCLSIRRRDGVSFHFTDHDQPVYESGLTFQPHDSFQRTSVATTLDLNVDGLELKGIMNSDAVSREDINAGKFDFAEVEVFAVDYEQPEAGKIVLRVGWIGEITTSEDGTYDAEVRGLSQVYTYRIGEAYAPECRADLGDRRCGVPTTPNRWQPGVTYRPREAVLGVINEASNYVILSFQNGSFEEDDSGDSVINPIGWTAVGNTQDGRWSFNSNLDNTTAKFGTQFVAHRNAAGRRSGEFGLTQALDLETQGVDLDAIDTGLSRLTASAWMACTSNVSRGRMRVYAISQTGGETPLYDSGERRGPEDQWFQEVGCKDFLIPSGTRKLAFTLVGYKKSDHGTGMVFDRPQAAINYPNGDYGSIDQYGGVCFRATNRGVSGAVEPSWSNLPGDLITDGTIVWECVQAWSQVATVRAPSGNNKSFVPTGVTGVEGYFDGGLLTWETGKNAGRSQEIKTWKGGRLTLFQRPFFPIRPDDRFVIRPGCDKRLGTCADKFSNAANFRAEPFVPGQEEYYKTPNSTVED